MPKMCNVTSLVVCCLFSLFLVFSLIKYDHIKSEEILHMEPNLLQEFRNAIAEMKNIIHEQNETIKHQNITIKSMERELLELRHITIETMREMSMVMQYTREDFEKKIKELQSNSYVSDLPLNCVHASIYMLAFGELVLVCLFAVFWREEQNREHVPIHTRQYIHQLLNYLFNIGSKTTPTANKELLY